MLCNGSTPKVSAGSIGGRLSSWPPIAAIAALPGESHQLQISSNRTLDYAFLDQYLPTTESKWPSLLSLIEVLVSLSLHIGKG